LRNFGELLALLRSTAIKGRHFQWIGRMICRNFN
jgi:hypothetical protein